MAPDEKLVNEALYYLHKASRVYLSDVQVRYLHLCVFRPLGGSCVEIFAYLLYAHAPTFTKIIYIQKVSLTINTLNFDLKHPPFC